MKAIPKIERTTFEGRDCFRVYDRDGNVAAAFYNEHFLERVMEEVFGWSVFEPLPIEESKAQATGGEK